ncbi:uncharacterized protein EI97DRAFT_429785 [Westerdykella ornata]|uniref:Uncharacterized protein n=1 Tax=Westerdykella ornata TaxID=318751 RepID=A0A6A6JTR6_WESOR|nr:uncharacterized protein EI97DRAFT_429785 [Westerdykella ornata]KAF2280020.1 hypothetical protein EI97DRAFT_429785 [Westerdykella ornata]
MKASRTTDSDLSVTLPYYIDFTIRRPGDDHGRPLIFRWGPYRNALANAELVLLHIAKHGPERVDVAPLQVAEPEPDSILVNGWNQFLWELPPGREVHMREKLTANYQRLLKPGESYELLWPGAEIRMWDWGSMQEHIGKELKSNNNREERLPPLILPACDIIAFTAREEEEPWPERPKATTDAEFQRANMKEQEWRLEAERRMHPPQSPPPREPSEREPGAPIFSMKIECPSEWASDSTIDLTIRVTYAGVPNEPNPKPITFHTEALITGDGPRDGIRLYRHRDGLWERSDPADGFGTGFGIFDDPPIPVKVGDENDKNSDRFESLQPGESWSTQRRVQQGTSWTSLPNDVKAGEAFKYVVKGAVVDWWDWGTKADHRDTVVKLPCWIAGDVVEPKDNGGRPTIVVPASNEIYFSYTG